MTAWWVEVDYGGREFIIPHRTIQKLHNRDTTTTDVVGVHSNDVIFARLANLENADRSMWNSVLIQGRDLPQVYFLKVYRHTGIIIVQGPTGTNWTVTGGGRTLCLGARDLARKKLHRGTPQPQLLDRKAIEQIPDLTTYIEHNGLWRREGIRVEELLRHLVGASKILRDTTIRFASGGSANFPNIAGKEYRREDRNEQRDNDNGQEDGSHYN